MKCGGYYLDVGLDGGVKWTLELSLSPLDIMLRGKKVFVTAAVALSLSCEGEGTCMWLGEACDGDCPA
jgi:hypothetical protein